VRTRNNVTTAMTTKAAAITQTSTLRMVGSDYSGLDGSLRIGFPIGSTILFVLRSNSNKGAAESIRRVLLR
jgi:hypothetical protein